MNNNRKWINEKTLTSRLLEKRELIDKNLRSYLVLRLEQVDGIFVFNSNVKEERWFYLQEGQEYNFSLGENEKGYLNLLDFS